MPIPRMRKSSRLNTITNGIRTMVKAIITSKMGKASAASSSKATETGQWPVAAAVAVDAARPGRPPRQNRLNNPIDKPRQIA
jgi:hypothetical protein